MTEKTKSNVFVLPEAYDKDKLLLDNFKDLGLFMLDRNGNIASWNTGAKKLYGYEAEEIIGKSFNTLYRKEDVLVNKPFLQLNYAKENGKFGKEELQLRKDNTNFWGDISAYKAVNERGEHLGFSIITRDISGNKENFNSPGDNLKLTEERYRMLVEQVSDYAIFMLDPTGHIVSWNAGAQKIKGYLPEEIIGKHFSIFYPPEDKEWDKPGFEIKMATAEGRFEDEGWRLRKDGTRFWANIILTAIRDDHGGLIGFSKITRDLTERRNAEEMVRNMKNELEKTVKQLQKSIAELNNEVSARKSIEEQLRQKNKLLELSNTDLEQFAYVASHDLKEPLRMIASYSSLLIKKFKQDDPDVKLYSNFILDGVNYLHSLINGLLDYSRIGRSDINFQDIDMNQVIERVKSSIGGKIDETDTVITSGPLPTVKGVSSLLTTLFQNLIVNAIKFRKPNETPVIDIEAKQDNGAWLFSVKDNGIGIQKEFYERIFGIFQRLHTRQVYEGTGIGLSISRKIVEFHNGKMWVESEPGKGSAFYFTLPIRK